MRTRFLITDKNWLRWSRGRAARRVTKDEAVDGEAVLALCVVSSARSVRLDASSHVLAKRWIDC